MEEISNDFILHATTMEEATVLLKSDTVQGLSIDEAKERLERFGLNTIEEAKAISPFLILTRQFKSPIVFLLLFAAGMSFGFKEWLDGIAILFVIIINAAIGFYMEFKAHKSVAALKKLSSIPAKVLRSGKLLEINAEEIVPGDIVFTEAGDMIPADGKIYRS
ncbi:MAG: cation-transporting P-type ATPase, partial [Ginsengibacter sp.]